MFWRFEVLYKNYDVLLYELHTTSGHFKLKHDFIVIFHFLKMKKKGLLVLGQNVMVPAIVPYWIKYLEHKSYFCLDKGKPVNIYTLYGVWQELPGCIFPALFIGCVISFFGWWCIVSSSDGQFLALFIWLVRILFQLRKFWNFGLGASKNLNLWPFLLVIYLS